MSVARFITPVLLVASVPCVAQTAETFEWPEANETALPDARLSEAVADARIAAREGADRALQGRQVSMQAKVRTSLRGAIGLGGKPTIIAAGTVMKAVPFNNESGPMLGTVNYPNGAGVVAP